MSRTVGRIGLVSELLRRGISPNYADDGILVVNQKCIRPDGVLDLQYSRRHDEADREIPEELLIQPGDILINSTGTGTLGRSCVVREVETRMTWDSHVTLVRPRQQKVHYSYLGWVIESEEQQLIELSVGSTNQIELSRGTVFNLEISLPPLETQQRIADYLDRETAEIDAAVANLDRYVELLEKRKIQTVENAVFGDHEGEFPLVPIQLLFKKIMSGTTPKGEHYYTDAAEDMPWITTSELREVDIYETKKCITTNALKEVSSLSVYPPDTILIAMYGATIGRFGRTRVAATSNQACCALFEPVGIDPEFFYNSLFALSKRLVEKAVGGGQPNINQDTIRRFRIPVPPPEKQRKIAVEVAHMLADTNALIGESTKLRDLLLKRRSVLITDVVTGRKQV